MYIEKGFPGLAGLQRNEGSRQHRAAASFDRSLQSLLYMMFCLRKPLFT
jgi:hypothetical protein